MRACLAGLFLAFCCLTGAAAQPAASPQSAPIKAAILIGPPFVMKSGGGYSGFTYELWQQIAADLKLNFEVQDVGTVAQVLQLVRDKRVDVVVGNLTITADRFLTMDFSQPYFDAGLRVMIDEERRAGLGSLITDLRQGGHLRIYAWIAVIILVATVVLTLIDRKWHPEFPEKWGDGLAESFRHVMSVATSGSASHPNLLGTFGKVLGALWLACGVAVVAYVTSSITSVMTASAIFHQINDVKDLGGKRVGAITGSTGEIYCRAAMFDVQSFDTLQASVDALLKGQISAIVLDAPVLEWYDNAHPELPVTVVGAVFQAEKYGFALPVDSKLTRGVSESILRLKDLGALDALRTKYFGTTR